jgi:hypothetical protein
MAWVIIGVAVVAVLAIALVTVGGVAGRLAAEPPLSVYDEDEAVEWIADRLPFEVAAQLTHDDVRALLLWHLEYYESKGIATETAFGVTPEGVVLADDDSLAYVLGRASEAGLDVDDVQVVTVIDAERDYLAAIGAIGPRVPDPTQPGPSQPGEASETA